MLLLTAAFKFNLRRYTVRVNSQTANLLAFQVRVAFDADVFEATVGRCRLPVSNPAFKAPMVSAVETVL